MSLDLVKEEKKIKKEIIRRVARILKSNCYLVCIGGLYKENGKETMKYKSLVGKDFPPQDIQTALDEFKRSAFTKI